MLSNNTIYYLNINRFSNKYCNKILTINMLTLNAISVNILVVKHVEFCINKKGGIL